ncbi:MAG TPA: hypothetical protein VK623_11465 [Flavobacterium sp.]|nr:hypothetical protein [Flavobacterium sp.]
MKKKVLLVILLILAIGAFATYRMLYKAHRDIATEEASFTLTPQILQQKFMTNDSVANMEYADKTVIITGKITNIDAAGNSITIDGKLSAVLKDKVANIKLQQPIKVKGRFVGYDDLLEELKMDQVTILN